MDLWLHLLSHKKNQLIEYLIKFIKFILIFISLYIKYVYFHFWTYIKSEILNSEISCQIIYFLGGLSCELDIQIYFYIEI